MVGLCVNYLLRSCVLLNLIRTCHLYKPTHIHVQRCITVCTSGYVFCFAIDFVVIKIDLCYFYLFNFVLSMAFRSHTSLRRTKYSVAVALVLYKYWFSILFYKILTTMSVVCASIQHLYRLMPTTNWN